MNFILASQSPRRKQILESAGIVFQSISPQFNEEAFIESYPKILKPDFLVKKLALEKALSIANDKKNYRLFKKDTVILSADTTVYHPKLKLILNKPQDKKEAAFMLKSLSGVPHVVFTGCCLLKIKKNKVVHKKILLEKTKVYFRVLLESEISYYIHKYKPFDKSGSYGIQDYGIHFIRSMEGCFLNVMGLPFSALSPHLMKFGVKSKYWKKNGS